MKKKGFTLIELLVVISIIAMLLAILMPALSKVKKIAQRVVCGTNLKGLGTAQTVYSQDYDDEYAVQGGRGTHDWDWVTSLWQSPDKNWNDDGTITIGASLYLLVREADVSPKSFICPSSDESEFDGMNTKDLDIVQLYDFGNEQKVKGSGYPYEHVSYAYQMPYGSDGRKGSYAADGTANASFAVMADKNPWLDPKIPNLGTSGMDGKTWTDHVGLMKPYYVVDSKWNESSREVKVANAYTHGRDGQNVVYADGHAAFEKVTDVGVQNDAIYLPTTDVPVPTEADIRRGDSSNLKGAPEHNAKLLQPTRGTDSFLVNDDTHNPDKGL